MEFLDKDPYPKKPIGVIILGWGVAILLIVDLLWCIL
jgi:hypothetical protein